MNKKNKDILIIGFALFSMFFGAGNLIFPPYIGVSSGSNWLVSFLGFILSDVGIIILSIYAISKAGSFYLMAKRAGNKFALILELIVMLCLGPILVIPRTGATTFEMGIEPLFNSLNPILFSILFFGIVFILTIKPTKVMDIIGKFLTPILLLALSVLIIKGIITPIGTFNSTLTDDSYFLTGLTQGYQTMDALGIGAIVLMIMTSLASKGYTNKKENISMALKSSLIAGIGLVLVYGGLAYLGATASTLYTVEISQTELLINITNLILGNTGISILSIVVTLACLTTAIGLTSVTAKYFEDITNNRIKYMHIVALITLFSAIMSNLGVDNIIAIAAPILTILYPVSIVLVVMGCFSEFITYDSTFKGAAYSTFIISLLTSLNDFGYNFSFIEHLPFSSLGFNWVIPALIGGFIFTLFEKKTLNNKITDDTLSKKAI